MRTTRPTIRGTVDQEAARGSLDQLQVAVLKRVKTKKKFQNGRRCQDQRFLGTKTDSPISAALAEVNSVDVLTGTATNPTVDAQQEWRRSSEPRKKKRNRKNLKSLGFKEKFIGKFVCNVTFSCPF